MPSGFYVRLNGMEDAQKQLQRIQRGTRRMGESRAYVYSKLPYAYGQEHGRHQRSGKLARRAGGAFYIRRAIDQVMSGADRDISEGLNKVTAPGPWVLRRLAGWTRKVARGFAPRKARGQKKSHSYRLYRSIRYEVRTPRRRYK